MEMEAAFTFSLPTETDMLSFLDPNVDRREFLDPNVDRREVGLQITQFVDEKDPSESEHWGDTVVLIGQNHKDVRVLPWNKICQNWPVCMKIPPTWMLFDELVQFEALGAFFVMPFYDISLTHKERKVWLTWRWRTLTSVSTSMQP